jgi:phosphoenolpyruvate carboxykinase (diphosphate)
MIPTIPADLRERIGHYPPGTEDQLEQDLLLMREYLAVKMAARGLPVIGGTAGFGFLEMGKALIANFQEKSRLLASHLCPADQAVHDFLRDCLGEEAEIFGHGQRLVPHSALVLERHGLARMLSVPVEGHRFESPLLTSYRVHQGVCHNPRNDRRTTEGVFHVCEGGLPVPFDKKEVPRRTFARLLMAALNPPPEFLRLPFAHGLPPEAQPEVFVSLLLRPLVRPQVPGVFGERRMEVRFFAPGNLVSNLDFVESIFGNAGDPYLPDNDARLDVDGWSGHSGCVILAPHLPTLRKKDLGLPHASEATERQQRDGMCWETEEELYNGGGAFKVTCRDRRGIIVTLIADSYFGYCKKEVKTQISYAANLMGGAEEEHAGGAIAFPCRDLGEDFELSRFDPEVDHSWVEQSGRFADIMDIQPDGYGIDRRFPSILYMPESLRMELHDQVLEWQHDGQTRRMKLLPDHIYVLPSGYKVRMDRPLGKRWRLVGTNAEGTFCHKPCTVSGGGKSEISKELSDAMFAGPVFLYHFDNDMRMAMEIIGRDFGDRFKQPMQPQAPSRPLLDPSRSLGSVIRMLTPAENYTVEYNAWLRSIPRHVRDLVCLVKRYWKPDWGEDWPAYFSVDSVNGRAGTELKYRNERLQTRYLRVGYESGGAWRTFGLRADFAPAYKLQTEDDISASTVVPKGRLDGLHPDLTASSFKFVSNCEWRLFQRPDEAIHRGYDRVTEENFSRKHMFFSNYEPLDREKAEILVENAVRFEHFTEPMKRAAREYVTAGTAGYFISSAHPRLVDGEQTKNPRYLQTRPDLEDERGRYLAEIGARLFRRQKIGRPLLMPVDAVLAGRRNNPPQPEHGIRALAVYNPIHFQELPELFMDFISSLTGKSPSTTGAGSEGALTKGPFNALLPSADLNSALLAYVLCGHHGFTSAAGYIGRVRVDHDISLLVPEVWSRMYIEERDPAFLIREGLLEKLEDIEHEGRIVSASRLGWRITPTFVQRFFGRVFADPGEVFTLEMMRPELQSLDDFVDGVQNITETQRRVALGYFEDGSYEDLLPPLQAVIQVMAHGHFDGLALDSPALRQLFSKELILSSDWYRERLAAKREVELRLCRRQIDNLKNFLSKGDYEIEARRLGLAESLASLEERLANLEEGEAAEIFGGTIGVEQWMKSL